MRAVLRGTGDHCRTFRPAVKVLAAETVPYQTSASVVRATAQASGPGVKGTVTVDVVTATGGVSLAADNGKKGGFVEGSVAALSVSGKLEGSAGSMTSTLCILCGGGGCKHTLQPSYTHIEWQW